MCDDDIRQRQHEWKRVVALKPMRFALAEHSESAISYPNYIYAAAEGENSGPDCDLEMHTAPPTQHIQMHSAHMLVAERKVR